MNKQYALLVIDMQLVAFDGKITPPINHASQLLDNVSELIRLCRRADIPIVYLQTCAYPGQPYAKDVHGWEIHPRLAPEPSDPVVFKVNSSGFDETSLHTCLQRLDVSKLIVCGNWSEYCVLATCRDALAEGYEVGLAADGHGTVSNTDAEADLVVASVNEQMRDEAEVFNNQEIRARFY